MAANTVRFLIAGSQAGGLIGMSGQNIETLRNSSGATITVLAQHQLPLCASAHESDRVVQVRSWYNWPFYILNCLHVYVSPIQCTYGFFDELQCDRCHIKPFISEVDSAVYSSQMLNTMYETLDVCHRKPYNFLETSDSSIQ